MEKYITTPFGFRRNLDYTITKVSILFKHLKEYKIDVYFSLISNFTFFVGYFIFYKVFFDFVDFLDWTNKEYILFFIAIWIGTLASMNFSLRKFNMTIITGRLNIYLYIPVNRYLSCVMDNTSGKNIFTSILNFIIFLILTLFYNYPFKYIFFGTIILIGGTVSFVVFNNFIFSFAFFIKEIGMLYDNVFKEIIYLNEKFTPVLLEQTYFNFFYLFIYLFVTPSILRIFCNRGT